jgi:hypothetical protein
VFTNSTACECVTLEITIKIECFQKSVFIYEVDFCRKYNSLGLGKLRKSQYVRYWCKVSDVKVTCVVPANCKSIK